MTFFLAIAVHFLILTQWITQQVTGSVQRTTVCELDMAGDAFDDQYEDCPEEMEKIIPQLLEEELKVNRNLSTEWRKAKVKWEEIKNKIHSSKQLNDFHGTALVAYTGKIAFEFNEAVRKYNQNPKNFHFKAFHYYLTRALQLLHKDQEPIVVYRGVKRKCSYSGKGNVRFGQFASSSISKKVAQNYADGGTLFTIYTGLGVSIQEFSYKPDEKEVLIPGYEVYQVIEKKVKNANEIILYSPRKRQSKCNCFFCDFNSSGVRESPAFILLLPGLLILLLLPAEL